jgi:hypothetical protein
MATVTWLSNGRIATSSNIGCEAFSLAGFSERIEWMKKELQNGESEVSVCG